MAKEKEYFPNFKNTNWAKGDLPVFSANKKALNLTEYKPNMELWGELSEEIKKHGTVFGLHLSIAPTATSGIAINSTPSIEPIFALEFKEESKGVSINTLSPNIRELGQYYKKAFDCNQKKLLELAAVRQIYLDQSQSINVYYKPPFSLKKLAEDTIYAFSLGVKTLYYFQTRKEGEEEICSSCS